MRTVYPNSEIPHLWVNQTQPHARGQGSIRFINTMLYSYAEPIGRLVKIGGKTVALFRDFQYSITTSKHQTQMRMAARHLPHFTVAEIAVKYVPDRLPHKANLKDYQKRIIAAAQTAKRARTSKEWQLNALTALVDEANRYAETFRLSTRFSVPSDIDLEKLAAEAKATAKREREKAEREAQRRREAMQEALTAWLSGNTVSVNLAYLPESYLRIEGQEVVTTHGARVPLEHVQRVIPFILRMFAKGETYQRNGHSIHLGHYVLDSIDKEGTIRAGCHTFKRSEVERFAAIMPAAATPALESTPVLA